MSVQRHIDRLNKLLPGWVAGDFSQDVPMPKKEDEFTPLFVGYQMLILSIRELAAEVERLERQAGDQAKRHISQ